MVSKLQAIQLLRSGKAIYATYLNKHGRLDKIRIRAIGNKYAYHAYTSLKIRVDSIVSYDHG